MQFKNILPLVVAIGSLASAQNLTEVLATNNNTLSALNGLLATQPELVAGLANMTNITLLAPSNAALQSFLSTAGTSAAATPGFITALLQYHVLNGTYHALNFTSRPQFLPTMLNNATFVNVTGGQRVEAMRNGTNVTITSGFVSKSSVVTPNLNFTGGTIHIIDRVLTLPESDSSTAVAANLTSVVGALSQANLVNPVNSLRDVTIFAPANSAFQAIGSAIGTLTTEQLSSILTYHVINGTVGYSSALTNTTLKTLGGGELTVRIENGSVFVNSARVLVPDVLVANGVVHVIDNVLNPNNTSVAPIATASSQSIAFSGASSVTTPILTSGVPTQTVVISNAPTGAGGAVSTSSSKAGGAVQTGAVGLGALFGGMGFLMNL